MSEAKTETAVGETRQSMIRVWLAISAVWVAFWLALASLVVFAGAGAGPDEIGLFALIVTTPPLAFLALGALSRWIFETLLQ
jgi:hypothetical protein